MKASAKDQAQWSEDELVVYYSVIIWRELANILNDVMESKRITKRYSSIWKSFAADVFLKT